MTDHAVDWSALRSLSDPRPLPSAVERMMSATQEEASRRAYWQIENNAFVHRDLYEATEPVTHLVATRIRSGRWTPEGLGHALDLLVEIAYGQPAQVEQVLGNDGIAVRCREVVTGCLPYLYTVVGAGQGARTGAASQEGGTDAGKTVSTEAVLLGVADLALELDDDPHRLYRLAEVLSHGPSTGPRVRERVDALVEAAAREPDDAGPDAWGGLPAQVGALPVLASWLADACAAPGGSGPPEVSQLLSPGSGLEAGEVIDLDYNTATSTLGVDLNLVPQGAPSGRRVEALTARLRCFPVTRLEAHGTLRSGTGDATFTVDPGPAGTRVSIRQGDFSLTAGCGEVHVISLR